MLLLVKKTIRQVSATTMGFHTLPHNDQLALMDHLANRGAAHIPLLAHFRLFHRSHGSYNYTGPISTSVAASDWGLYYGGVFDGCPYDENIAVNHAVQLVSFSILNLQILSRWATELTPKTEIIG